MTHQHGAGRWLINRQGGYGIYEGNRAMNIIDRIGNKQIEKVLGQRQLPEFAPGDTVRVDVKVIEGTRERIQALKGSALRGKAMALIRHSPFGRFHMVKA